MDFKVINKAIAVTENLYDGFDERPVDCDFVLPDYYPDIAAVLKCTLKPVIQSKQLSGDRMIIDGTAVLQVLYLDEARKCARSCEFTKPFTSTFTVKPVSGNPVVWTSAKPDYVNCRATSPRRLDIHGSFSVKLKMQAEGGNDVISSISGDNVFTRKNVVSYTVPAASAEKTFSVNEVLDLGQEKPPAEALIRGEAVPVLDDCKLLANKAILKGNLLLKNLYVSDLTTGDIQSVSHEIPFSQIIDVEGLEEEWQCDVHLDVTSSEVHISVNQNGENRLLEVNMKVTATVYGYRTGMAEVVTDAYSTRCPLKLENQRVDTEHMIAIRRGTSSVKETLDLPSDGIASVEDIWCEAVPTSATCEEGKSRLGGRLMIFMLARDGAGNVSFYERPTDFQLEYDDNCSSVSADMDVVDVDFTMVGSAKVDINAQLGITRRCLDTDSTNAVSSITADENASFPAEKTALKIYFANKGESLWEVAKACHTSMDAVMEENALENDVLSENTMLLVPLC